VVQEQEQQQQPRVNGETKKNARGAVRREDPALVEFAPSKAYYDPQDVLLKQKQQEQQQQQLSSSLQNHYPFALMMQGSAPYIANHAGQTVVFHIPGELLLDNTKQQADQLLNDIGLVWLLGMKIVLVVNCRHDTCDLDYVDHPHECHNSLKVTDGDTLRAVEEEAGYLRTEVERKLNKYLRLLHVNSAVGDGNVVSGNFYSAQTFGQIRGQDFGYTGFCRSVNVQKIQNVINNNDICLLTTVGSSKLGDLVNTNGYHLAATVASALGAYKLVYMSNEGTLLQRKGQQRPLQDIALSFAKDLCDYHQVQVHNTGFATFEAAKQALEPGAVELLLHLAWASWALENGVERAHIVNPGDGALLEELFTSKNGANTCIMQNEPYNEDDDDEDQEDLDWDEFFASASKLGRKNETTFR
jgi:amino-acid N-acetyltransferase